MRLLAVLAFGLFLISGASLAAGPYDGNWSGAVQGTGTHCMSGSVKMLISNNAISGVIGLAAGSIRIQGNVAADGSVKATYNNPSTGGESTLTGNNLGRRLHRHAGIEVPEHRRRLRPERDRQALLVSQPAGAGMRDHLLHQAGQRLILDPAGQNP